MLLPTLDSRSALAAWHILPTTREAAGAKLLRLRMAVPQPKRVLT